MHVLYMSIISSYKLNFDVQSLNIISLSPGHLLEVTSTDQRWPSDYLIMLKLLHIKVKLIANMLMYNTCLPN